MRKTHKWSIIRKVLFGKGRYIFFVIDSERLPVEGDTVTVGKLAAEFKRLKKK